MVRFLGILLLCSSLTACQFLNLNNNKAEGRAARCKQLNRDIIYINATPDALVAAHQSAQLDNLNRSYKAEGCT